MFYIVLYGGGLRLKTSMNYDIFQDWLEIVFVVIVIFILVAVIYDMNNMKAIKRV